MLLTASAERRPASPRRGPAPRSKGRIREHEGIDASELDAYVDAFVADGLARITRRVSMELDDDGEALAGGLLTRIAAEPDGALQAPSQKPCWEAHVDKDNKCAHDYSALVYFEDGGVDFGEAP